MLRWGSGIQHKEGRITNENSKRSVVRIYTENTMGRYVQYIISREDFLERFREWLLTLEDERMQLLRRFIFEVDLAETEELKEVLYQYGSHLSEKNYLERKFFEHMAGVIRQLEQNCRAAAAQPQAL